MAAPLAVRCLLVSALPGVASASPSAHASVGFEPAPLSLATDPAGNVYVADAAEP